VPSGLELAVYRPTGPLASYVRAFQVISTKDSARVSVLDFAGADVSIPLRFADPVFVEGSGLEEVPSAAFVGPRARSVWLRFDGRIDQLNVSFFPGVAGAFVGISMPEVVGRVVSPDEVWPRDFREAVAELEPLPVEDRISRLSDLLLARLSPEREPGPQVREAVRLIYARHGRIRVRALAEEVNLSVSQLERRFKRHVQDHGRARRLLRCSGLISTAACRRDDHRVDMRSHRTNASPRVTGAGGIDRARGVRPRPNSCTFVAEPDIAGSAHKAAR
jgi:hypothetical protein